jgi:PLP dependent protein
VPRLAGELSLLDLNLSGIMTVAPQEEAAAKDAFDTVTRLADTLGLPERSMGMSEDLELAVAAGSTMVRIGRALFGNRSPGVAG